MFTNVVTTIAVRSLDTSLRFYCDTLGFRLIHRVDDRIIHLDCAGVMVALRPFDGPAHATQSSSIHLGFDVVDLDGARDKLEGGGVVFLGESIDLGVARVAFFNDPDGTPLYLCEWSHWRTIIH